MTDQVTPSQAGEAMETMRRFLNQLAVTASQHAEYPDALEQVHFTLDISGNLPGGMPYGGSDFQIWVHIPGWAESVTHSNATTTALKAVAMSSMVETLRSVSQRATPAQAAE